MLRPRIIPCLLIDNGRLIKTKAFSDPKYVGDPINAVKIFNEKEVDELILFDIGAWRTGRPDFKLLEKIAVESRMPLCYGGGIRTSEQSARIINTGFEKVSVSTAAVHDPAIVSRIAAVIGSQSVVVTLDVRAVPHSDRYAVYTQNGTARANVDLDAHCEAVVGAGAGEIVINSIDLEGSGNGYDLALAKRLSKRFQIPMTFLGGAGNPGHMAELIETVGVVGAAAGSMFVFKGALRAVLISYARPPGLF